MWIRNISWIPNNFKLEVLHAVAFYAAQCMWFAFNEQKSERSSLKTDFPNILH